MEQSKIVVDIQNLSKSIKKENLLLPLHYQLTGGKILALCGGNGAGKSTLIRLIIGLMKPTTGHVLINGLHRKEHRQHFTKQFGYMPDDFLFQQTMTTKETIHFYAQMKQIDKARYEEVLQEVGLHEKMNELVGNFSKGMKQRLLLAQALLATPDILILDEPTNGLDPYWVKRFSDLMLHAKEKGQTVIFSTHDLHVVEQIADEVMFLSNGELISDGAIDRFWEKDDYISFMNDNLEILDQVTK